MKPAACPAAVTTGLFPDISKCPLGKGRELSLVGQPLESSEKTWIIPKSNGSFLALTGAQDRSKDHLYALSSSSVCTHSISCMKIALTLGASKCIFSWITGTVAFLKIILGTRSYKDQGHVMWASQSLNFEPLCSLCTAKPLTNTTEHQVITHQEKLPTHQPERTFICPLVCTYILSLYRFQN